MKITAGLGSADDYPLFAEAGADECFCGYVPFSRAEKYGNLNPLNRREVRAYNVQIGSYEEMKICRVIFHRKNTVEEIRSCISHLKQNIEYEAFVLNEQCHFSGAFCNSLHCDELGHLCQTPYRLEPIRQKESRELEVMLQKLHTEAMLQDIRQLKRSLEILETAGTEREFQRNMKTEIFPDGCSGNCYYRS